MNEVLQAIAQAVNSDTLVRVVFSQPRADGLPTRIGIRPVRLRGGLHYQASRRVGAQELHENLTPEVLLSQVRENLEGFGQVNLFTESEELELRRRRSGRSHVVRKPAARRPVALEHNRERQYVLREGEACPFLVATGVMTASGQVRAPRRKKFRQINRFLEIVQDVVEFLPAEREVRVVDFGCGRSYLTFALHHLFVHVLQRPVRILGLDLKPKVIQDCRRLAAELGCDGLDFQEGDIAGHTATGHVDLCVSLHACNTATDDALAQAVRWNTRVILAVPCCHKELAEQLHNADQAALLRHGILRERYAAMATDALRASALDVKGYRSQVLEFIDTEHTPKNLMIRAVRRADGQAGPSAAEDYRNLRRSLGVRSFHLETAMGLELPE